MNLYDLAPDLAEFAATADRSCEAVAELPLPEAAQRLADDGLTGVLMPEPDGLGLSLPHALPVLRAAGAARLAVPLVQTLAASHLAPFMPDGMAAKITSGAAILTAAPVAQVFEEAGQLTGRAGFVPQADKAALAVVPLGGGMLAIADLQGPGVSVRAQSALDEICPVFTVDFDGAEAAIVRDAGAVAEFHLRMDLFQSIDASAAAWAAMSRAITHLTERSQFGQPLIGFQSLRHDLARARMELHSLDRLIWTALQEPDAKLRAGHAGSARARASACCPGIAETALHMQGGMGFTRLIPAHEWVRRIRSGMAPRNAGAMYQEVMTRVLAAE